MKTAQFKKLQKGFTLIELLVVIAVLGVLAVAVIAAINPQGKLNSANDANGKSDIVQVATALQNYYTSNSQSYPTTANLSTLVTAGEMKALPPVTAAAASGNNALGTEYYASDGNNFAIWYISKGSATTWYCLDSGTNNKMKTESVANTMTSSSTACQ